MQEYAAEKKRILLAILCFLILVPLLLSWIQSNYSLFVFRDGFATHYPIKKLFIDQIKNGNIPYWNPAASFGQPLLANPNNLPFYPDNLLYLAFPFDIAWNLHFWFHWIFGAFGIFQLLKSMHKDSRIAWIGTIWWAGSGFMLSLFSFYNLIAATAWIPWMLLSLRCIHRDSKIRDAMALGLCTALQFLAGEPVTSLSTWLLLFLFCLAWRKGFSLERAGWIAFSGAIALLLVLPQLISLSEIYPYTSRAMVQHSYVTSSNSSFEPQRFLEWFVPYCWGIPYEKAPHLFLGRKFSYFPFFIHSLHVSLFLLFCFLLAVRKLRRVLFGGILLYLLLCLGRYTPFWKALFDYAPGFDHVRFPIKFFSGLLLLLILAAAEGLRTFFKEPGKHIPAILILASTWLIFVFLYLTKTLEFRPFFIYQILLAGGLLALLILVLLRFPKYVLLFVVLEALIAARFLWLGVNKSDLLQPEYSPGISRTFVSKEMFPVRPGFESVGALYHDESRVAFPLWGAPFGFRYALDDSPEGLYSYYNDYLTGFFQSLPMPQKFEMLSRLGVGQVVSKHNVVPLHWEKTKRDSYYIYSRDNPLPILFPTVSVRDAASPEIALRGLVLGETVSARWKTEGSPFVLPKKIGYKQIHPGEYQIDLESAGPVFLASRITYYPTWKAIGILPDGLPRELKMNQVDLSFVGFEVPAGVRKVTLSYESRVKSGFLIGWAALMGAVLFIVAARMPRRS